ncbi:hypothetical protein [Clostridium sp.]|uniref:hypothetical protein n=1 Tax=Clostridium sp. TaxID=1506 RepID=UPI00284943BE|nr:hypothetical protein [Clostridium sp.]MDR3595732.1 hypothetical protein [Clostridium sp.]
MYNENNFTFEDDIEFEKFEFSSFPYESLERQKQPFTPPKPGGNFPPPISNFPSNPSGNQPNFNYPGGTFNPPGMPKSPPPNYTPQKNATGVQTLNAASGGAETKAVSSNSIRFCLYKYTYIWETNGRSYWTFLLNVDKRTASGFRWYRNTWVYWGVDLRRIDSFICYRSSTLCDNCTDCIDLNRGDKSQLNINKEYSLNDTKEIYSHTLTSIDIPEIKEDVITRTIGCIDDTEIKNDLPCVKTRNIGYRLTLEITYPSSYDDISKNTIQKLANEASEAAYEVISATRSDNNCANPLETYNSSLSLAPKALKAFSASFNNKLNSLGSSMDNCNDIAYSIRSEKIYTNWKPCFYKD